MSVDDQQITSSGSLEFSILDFVGLVKPTNNTFWPSFITPPTITGMVARKRFYFKVLENKTNLPALISIASAFRRFFICNLLSIGKCLTASIASVISKRFAPEVRQYNLLNLFKLMG